MIIQGVALTGTTVFDTGYVTDGLVYYADVGKTSSYPGSGTSINNISGTAIGAMAVGATYTSAGSSSYFSFNGSQTVYCPTMLSLFNSPVNNNVTLEVWVRTASDNGVVLSEQGASPINAGWHDAQIEIVSGNLKMAVWTAAGGYSTVITPGAVTRNRWQQYVLTFDVATSTLRGYINGSTTASATGITRGSPQSTGQPQLYYDLMYQDFTNLGDGTGLVGDWSIFRVYNRALTAAEVLLNYQGSAGRYS